MNVEDYIDPLGLVSRGRHAEVRQDLLVDPDRGGDDGVPPAPYRRSLYTALPRV
jgi:hypothetical protein